MRVQLLRKERSVGVAPQASTIYEVLEELAIAVQVLFPPVQAYCFLSHVCFLNGSQIIVTESQAIFMTQPLVYLTTVAAEMCFGSRPSLQMLSWDDRPSVMCWE